MNVIKNNQSAISMLSSIQLKSYIHCQPLQVALREIVSEQSWLECEWSVMTEMWVISHVWKVNIGDLGAPSIG